MSDYYLPGYVLRDVARGQAKVHDDEEHEYRATLKKLSGAGIPGRCRGKWSVFNEVTDRWATTDDLTEDNRKYILFAEQTMAGSFKLVFRTRNDAASFAVRTF